MELEWNASKLTVVQHPDLRLTVSGAGRLDYQEARFSLHGELTADKGRVELRNRTFPALGTDVVVSGHEHSTQIAIKTRVADLDMSLDLGPDFTVVGRGIDARMAGRIRLTSTAQNTLTAFGEIRVASGTFEAYGRRLHIEQGILFFSGPVDNPGINIRAMRKNQPVEAGVEVTGTARDPRVLLVSDPEVPDPDKLAWLVLGRQAETGDAQDNQALQSSAVALAAGLGTTPFQQQLTQIVGVDEINFIPGAGQSQDGVVAVGKQISDKVYVTQEIGLRAAGNTLRVSYQLSRRWSLRTESGETDAVDIFFTLSFD
jgi:translocation and assembly module TamB